MKTYQIRIKGTVQGVGFRPFIYKLSLEQGLKGTVQNDSSGVLISILTTKEKLESYIDLINQNKPILAQIDSIEYKEVLYKEYTSFSIIKTQNQKEQITIMPPDISICKECEDELNDPNNRRYKYPFITCTNCGPRYTIIKHLPYDRVNTSMENFKMCEACKKEYSNPMDRRYHAQPIGCFDCGPKLSLLDNLGEDLKLNDEQSIDEVVKFINDGNILAIKGVGGYHLVCDATNKKVVQKLRDRKHRPDKPFAVMVKNTFKAKQLAKINKKEQELLESVQRPIVLLEKSEKYSKVLSDNVAPCIDKIGLFLPYTPIHNLILEKLDKPIVATSANLSDEPLCINFKEVLKLSNVWDYCLDHNREIVNGCDDSVVAVVKEKELFFRRARGYAPGSIKSPIRFIQNVLALGANQKSTIAIGIKDNIILSPHIGDLNSIHSIKYFDKNIENLKRIYDFDPDVIVYDKHKGYESSKYASEKLFECKDLKGINIQHHYAHMLAVMVEKKIEKKVLGISFDGTGLGDDGKLWGGEFMICDLNSYKRVNHLKYFKLIGGEKAIKEPRRVALSLLFDVYGKEALNLIHPTIKSFKKVELNTLFISYEKNLNAPLSSSMGRLFDGVASLADIIHVISYEGQSGAMMESYYDKSIKDYYSFKIEDEVIDIEPMVKEIIDQKDKTIIVSKFFNTIVEIIVTIANKYNYPVVLSGGVFQNIVLMNLILERIPDAIFSNIVPPNDGAISLGQIIKAHELF
jgi:hydrogenase maturation protein HypF